MTSTALFYDSKTFHIKLFADHDKEVEELKRLPKFEGLVHISATRCRKIGGAESLEEIRYLNSCAKCDYKTIVTSIHIVRG